MKTILMLITLIFLCFACGKAKPGVFTHEILLVDITDTTDKVDKADLSSYGKISREEGMCLSLVLITDVYNNPKETICIDSFTDGITANVISRNHAISDFKQERDQLFSELDSVNYGCEQSEVLRAVCRELSFLSDKSSGTTKRLVVFSNLFENTEVFSVFRKSDLKKLEKPAQLADFFTNQYSIPDRLDGITLEIRYKPTRETEVLHDQMIELYRHLFEVRGCTLKTHVEHITNIH